jgi:hypothetical protein
MIENLPLYLSISFGLITLFILILINWIVQGSNSKSVQRQSIRINMVLGIWLVIQTLFTINHVYTDDTDSIPPKLAILGMIPTIMMILLIFISPSGRRAIDSLPPMRITYLNTIRIPVELILYALFLHKAIPESMTFAGCNLDILAGITAPFVAYYGFKKQKFNSRVILIWNIMSLALLINIIIIALLSAPTPFQQFAFEQPNIAILHFPFSWLPTFIVPIVILGHLISIRYFLLNQANPTQK